MENPKTLTNQNLFHTQVLKDALKQDPIPSGHKQILQDWSKNIEALNQQEKTKQHTAFLQKILVDLLGYQAASGDNAFTLNDMAALGSYFDAALGQFEKSSGKVVTLIKLMGPSSSSLDTVAGNEQLSIIELARKNAESMQGSQFFLLSNLDEVRLYSLTLKRTAFERFSLAKMAEDAAEYQRFLLLLNPENMLSGKTAQWLDESVAAGLQDKLTKDHPTLKDAYGPIQSGIAIGLNDAFVIDMKTYNQLKKEDPKSVEILKLFYPGDSMKRWHSGSRIHWLIYTPKGKVDIDAYPAIKKYLEQFKDQLEKRSGDQKWYELNHTEKADVPTDTPFRLGTGRLQAEPGFVFGDKDSHYGDESHYITNADYYLFGLLNSNAIARVITTMSRQLENGMYEVLAHHVESLPVPDAGGMERARMGQLAQYCMEKAQDRRDANLHFHGMTAFNLSPLKLEAKLSDRLKKWYELDFPTFRLEVVSSFGVDIPEAELPTWSGYFEQEKENLDLMDHQLGVQEKELNLVVYQIFGLDEDDIALIEQG
ncbi:type II restriction endonuclease [Oxalobacter sp. OttesenSCG-928-P03]|nr:type II restriction endonuclease [Oxalobacter sp. OttesenSCG-928-P03]